MSTHYDETGPYIALTEREKAKVAKECKESCRAWRREAERKKPNVEIVEEMRDMCWQCVGRRACTQEADAWLRCFKSLRGCGEYLGMTDCSEYLRPLEQCAARPANDLFPGKG